MSWENVIHASDKKKSVAANKQSFTPKTKNKIVAKKDIHASE